MGMRRNIKLIYEPGQSDELRPIYFYAHWGGETMPKKLQNALIRGKERWNDESYLARIIFSELINEEKMDLQGYGIAPYEMDENYPTIVVNLPDNTVDEIPFTEFIEMDVEHYNEKNEED